MSGRSKRSLFTLGSTRTDGHGQEGLWRACGQACGVFQDGFEALEARVLLAGDHPSLIDFPIATEIVLDPVTGEGFDTGVIENTGEDDLFKFTAPETDFVTIRADGVNPARRSGDSTPLDTRIKIFDASGELIADSSGDGVLTGGTPTDAWFGFVATGGMEYFVDVLSDSNDVEDGTGEYVLRIDGISERLVVDPLTGEATTQDVLDDPAFEPPVGLPLIAGELGADDPATGTPDDEFSGDDIIYSITTGSGSFFDSIAAASVAADDTDFDPRLEIFDSTGGDVVQDSQAGYLTDPFASFRSSPDTTYYIRVRSDEFGDPAEDQSAGQYFLKVDLASEEIVLDPVTRRGVTGEPVRNTNPDNPFDVNTSPFFRTSSDFNIFRFESKGFGQSFETAISLPVQGLHDLQLTLIDEDGNTLSFVDDLVGTTPEIREVLEGGKTYFLIASGFDDAHPGWSPDTPNDSWTSEPFQINVEAHHNTNQSDDFAIDDHPNTHDIDPNLPLEVRKRLFEQATPLIFSEPFATLDGDGNPVRDRGYRQSVNIQGRIWDADPTNGRGDDTDLFQFVPPVDMLGQYPGNNDDVGAALFVGGKFSGAEQETEPVPVDSPGIALWDAFDWFAVGPRPTLVNPYGIFDNPDTPETSGPEVYALFETTIDLGTGLGPQPALVVGGDFNVTYASPLGPRTVQNLAVWAYHPAPPQGGVDEQGLAGRYTWFGTLGSADGPVRAFEEITFTETFDSTGDGNDDITLMNVGPFLAVGGEFTTIGAANTAADSLALFDLNAGTWTGLMGIDGAVHALAAYDPADPGEGRDPPDVNAINSLDVVVINRDTPTANISVLLNEQGNGVLGEPNEFGNLTTPNVVVQDDFNSPGGGQDGVADLAVLDPIRREVTLFTNDAAGGVAFTQGDAISLSLSSDQRPTDMVAADFSGDGLPDLVVVSSSTTSDTGRFVYLRNLGGGSFATPFVLPITTLQNSVLKVDAGDLVSGAAVTDLAISDSLRDVVHIVQNDSTDTIPSFTISEVAIDGGSTPVDIAVGDLDQDGIADIATANENSNTVKILFNNNDGTFDNTGGLFSTGGSAPSAIVLAPMLSGDSENDILVTNKDTSTIAILKHQAGVPGDFSNVQVFATDSTGAMDDPVALEVGDLNGDGDLDVVTVNSATDTVSVLFGTGAQTLTTPAQKYATGQDNIDDVPVSIAIANVDIDLDSGVLPEVPNPPDPPNSLFIGGEFTLDVQTFFGTTETAQNIATYNGSFFAPAGFGSSEVDGVNPDPVPPPSVVDGPVYALQVHSPSVQQLDGSIEVEGTFLYIGGEFTNAGGVDANNIIRMGRVDDGQDPGALGYTPSLLWETIGNGSGNGTDGPVYALEEWDPPEVAGLLPDPMDFPVLVVGGEFANVGNNVAQVTLGSFAEMGPGFDGPVRALKAMFEAQEPGMQIIDNEAAENDREIVYAGGDFLNIDPDAPVPAGHLAYYDVINTPFGPAFAWQATREGADDSIFALEEFDDTNPAFDNSNLKWDRHDRAATRASLTVSPTLDSFADMFVRIYDSDLNIIYTNDTVAPPFPDPAGGFDPSLRQPAAAQTFALPPMWGGETYYIEVSSTTGGTGSYTLNLVVDAVPPQDDEPDDGVLKDINATYIDVASDFADARTVSLDAFGESVNFNNVADPPHITGDELRIFKPSPGTEDKGSIIYSQDYGSIWTIDDEDFFVFTAQTTGTAEVRLSTLKTLSGPADEFLEFYNGDARSTSRKDFDSPFDGAIRVFNNDLEQIAYNDDSGVIRGDFMVQTTGTIAATNFSERDPRVVFNVVEGERYFIVVESGQRYLDGSPADPADRVEAEGLQIDPRRAIGSYRLIINSPSSQDTLNASHTGDDHMDFLDGTGATPIPIDEFGNSVLGLFINDNGTPQDPSDDFTYDGTIGDPATGNFGTDIDVFEYTAPGDGTIDITVDRAPLSPGLTPAITATDQDGQVLGAASATSETPATLSVPVSLGQKINIAVSALGDTTGQFTLDVRGPVTPDDFASEGEWAFAEPIQLFDFLGLGSIDGTIERAGDSDIFSFQAFDFQQMTIRAEARDGSVFNPRLRVFEVQEDLDGNAFRVLIAQSDETDSDGDGVLDSTASEVTISVNTDRTSLETMNTYNDYYIVVDGSDSGSSKGDYTLSVEFEQTDDHADRPEIEDENTRDLATLILIDSVTGQGSQTGTIEENTDSDAFTFFAPAGGSMGVSVTRQIGSTLEAKVTALDSDLNELDVFEGDLPGSLFFDVVRGQQYFLIVEPATGADEGDDIGAYTVSLDGPAIDDHPNAGEFDLATPIILDDVTGDGQVGTGVAGGDNPILSPSRDTDLFRFDVIADGEVLVGLIPLGNFVTLRPKLSIFDGDENLIETVSSTNEGETVTIEIADALKGERYFILVEDALGTAPPSAEYTVVVNGQGGEVEPPNDPSIIDFDNPVEIVLDSRGDGERTDVIDEIGDRDLFTFVAPSAGRAFVQVVTPNGSTLDASITILDQANEDPGSVVVFDAGGVPGATADAEFETEEGQRYYAIVDGLGNATGSYTLRLNLVAPPVETGIDEVDALGFTNRLFYPEGFANNRISEFVSIANANDFDVRYSVILRYETGQRDAVIVNNATIAAGARSGITLTDPREGQAPGVRKNSPYSIEIVSDAPLGATLSHYDFDISTGEAFTETTSDEWLFARVERDPGLVNDFIVFFNPNPFDVDVTLTTVSNGQTIELTKTVGALRRGGWNINAENSLPTGVFGVEITARATDSANDGAFIGIVAGLSHFDVAGSNGFGVLGDADGGAKAGVIASIESGSEITSEIVIYNSRNTPATVDLNGQYIRADLPDLARRFQVPAKSSIVLSGADLGLIENQPIGLTFTANRKISVVSSEVQKGDANGTTAPSEVGREFFFGDAFVGRKAAGTKYFETLNFYNPASQNIDIEIELFYLNGTTDTATVTVEGGGFAEFALHEFEQSLQNPDRTNFFSIRTSSASPYVVELTHYDLFLGGGWTMGGAPFGLLNPIDRII